MHKIGQSGGFLGKLLGPLLKIITDHYWPLVSLIAKSVLIPLGLMAAASASATDAAIHKKRFGSGNTTLVTSNEEMNYIMKIIKSLEKFRLLMKCSLLIQ